MTKTQTEHLSPQGLETRRKWILQQPKLVKFMNNPELLKVINAVAGVCSSDTEKRSYKQE